ncbi:MAG: hypothetical protein OXJ37_00550 [Bryobacterales bacterium]|nr:hypothetical protein [Bryobacterales bacterium]
MHRYPAMWGVCDDPENAFFGWHHLVFPDFPDWGVGVSSSLDDALLEGEQFLRERIEEDYTARGLDPPSPSDFNNVEVLPGHVLLAIPLIRLSGHTVRVHMKLDEGVLAFIDGEARRRDMTRTAYVEWMARRIAKVGG